MDRRILGCNAESIARDFLVAHGLTVVAQNYRCRLGELDLVLRDRNTLAVVEVRLRTSSRFGGACASIDRRKRERIMLATRHLLLSRRELRHLPVRFDVVAFEASGALNDPQWIRGAFAAE